MEVQLVGNAEADVDPTEVALDYIAAAADVELLGHRGTTAVIRFLPRRRRTTFAAAGFHHASSRCSRRSPSGIGSGCSRCSPTTTPAPTTRLAGSPTLPASMARPATPTRTRG